MATAEILNDIINDNVHAMVSESIYNSQLKQTYEDLVKSNTAGTKVEFDPAKHLSYYNDDSLQKHKFNNTRRLTMEELGLSNANQISPIGVSDPFPLFTEEAISIMRQEILEKEVFLKYARYSNSSTTGKDCSIRGYTDATPFTKTAWTHPKTMELVSLMAGVELEVVLDYEIASVNVSMKDKAQAEAELEENDKKGSSEVDAVVGWHYDSYPFVCVLMLSDTSTMIGGETSLKMGKGMEDNIACVPGPTQGSAAVLQGRFVEHMAPNPIGATERITMVTSYRAKQASIPDKSVLYTVKPEINYGSRYTDFYKDWIKSRTTQMIKNLNHINEKCQDTAKFDKEKVTEELKEIEEYLVQSYKHMEVSDKDWDMIIHNHKRIFQK